MRTRYMKEPSRLRLLGKGFVMLRGNDPKHTSKHYKDYFEIQEKQNNLKMMIWSPHSPALNHTELLWDELDRNIRKKHPTPKNHLWSLFQAARRDLSHDTLRKLIERMSRIVKGSNKFKRLFFLN